MPDGISIPGGPVFIGFPQPPDVPCDPTGDGWRGPPGPVGPIGPIGPPGPVGGLDGGTLAGPLYWTATGATASRSAQNRSAQPYSVMDFGAKMDGVTDDSAAFVAAYNATPNLGTIYVPPGGVHIPTFTASTSKALLWRLSGNAFDTGSTPVGGFGNSIVETIMPNATKYLGRLNSIGMENSVGAVLRADMTLTHANGATGGVAALDINASTSAVSTLNQAPYAISGRLTMRSTQFGGSVGTSGYVSCVKALGAGNATPFGGNILSDDQSLLSSFTTGGAIGCEIDLKANGLDDGVAADGYSFSPYVRVPIASMTWTAATVTPPVPAFVTVTSTTPHNMPTVGTGIPVAPSPWLSIQSVVPSGYNGTVYCKVTGPNTFTYPLVTNPGVVTTQGTWNATFQGSQRAVLTLQYGRSERDDTNQMEVANVLGIGYFSTSVDGAYASAKNIIAVHGRVSFAGLNFIHATFSGSAQAIAMQDGQSIGWTADPNTNDPTTCVPPTHWSSLQYRQTAPASGVYRLYYTVNGVDKWSVDASGNMRCAGTVTGSVTP